MADEADEQSGHGAERGGHEGQQAVLDGDGGVGYRAGNGHETAQHEKQRRADAGGNHGFHSKVLFHLSFLLSSPLSDPSPGRNAGDLPEYLPSPPPGGNGAFLSQRVTSS